MKQLLRLLFAAGMLTCAGAQAADFDGSRPLLCASIEAIDCAPEEQCVKGLPKDIGVPQFLRIDFDRKVIAGPKSESPIKLMEQANNQMLLQGTELGYAWTLVLDQENGTTVATLANQEGAFVVFGACTPQ